MEADKFVRLELSQRTAISSLLSHPPHLRNSRFWRGRRIGLLGGSFNPGHEGHIHISLIAMKTLKLDMIWWLITPGNPLKQNAHLPSIDDRAAQCQALINHPYIVVSDLERQTLTRQSYKTVSALTRHFPATEFVWIAGMDNAMTIHHWNRWKTILKKMPTAFISRPPAMSLIRQCPLKMIGTQSHKHIHKAAYYPLDSQKTYWILDKKMMDISSTKIRKR